jgi:hypothetical protein
MASMTEMIAAVREYALANYEKGWDVVVETMSDQDLRQAIGRCGTVQGAIRSVWAEIASYVERRKDIQRLAIRSVWAEIASYVERRGLELNHESNSRGPVPGSP